MLQYNRLKLPEDEVFFRSVSELLKLFIAGIIIRAMERNQIILVLFAPENIKVLDTSLYKSFSTLRHTKGHRKPKIFFKNTLKTVRAYPGDNLTATRMFCRKTSNKVQLMLFSGYALDEFKILLLVHTVTGTSGLKGSKCLLCKILEELQPVLVQHIRMNDTPVSFDGDIKRNFPADSHVALQGLKKFFTLGAVDQHGGGPPAVVQLAVKILDTPEISHGKISLTRQTIDLACTACQILGNALKVGPKIGVSFQRLGIFCSISKPGIHACMPAPRLFGFELQPGQCLSA